MKHSSTIDREHLDTARVAVSFDGASNYARLRRQKRDLLTEQESRWAEGNPLTPEELLQRWPGDPQLDADVASVLFDDLMKRRDSGGDADIDDYSKRFPDHEKSLKGLRAKQEYLRTVGVEISSRPLSLSFPEVGDQLFGFRFHSELGRGAFARVFLAEQIELAGRAVAVKVSAIQGNEPQTLAQMQHTHIVPIYAVHEDERLGLRAVCMPYFGGASLSCVLENLWKQTPVPLHGRQLTESLYRVQSPPALAGRFPSRVQMADDRRSSESDTTSRLEFATICDADTLSELSDSRPKPARTGFSSGPSTPVAVLKSGSYIRAAVWMIARLAEGLQHAHDRGVLHRDIKPSNILVGADGQPMLLDFNLSQNQNGDPAEAVLGGTIAYMAPEHLMAMSRRTPELICQVDRRSDVYSLGMVLYEMLSGKKPFEDSAGYSILPLKLEAMATERSRGALSLRSMRKDAPWSLESILRKCLAPQPADRYQQAEHLAEDLGCFLEDLPLKYAPELSRVESLKKWTKRHPRLAYSGAVTLIAGLLLGLAGTAVVAGQRHLRGTREVLGTVQAEQRREAFEAGVSKALCLVNTVAGPIEQLPQGAQVCEETLAHYGILTGDRWQEPAEWQKLPPRDRQRLAEDSRELLMLLANARVRLSSSDAPALQGALKLLDRAESIPDLPPSRALGIDRTRYLEALGAATEAETARQNAERIPVSSAREHYMLAASIAQTGTSAARQRAIAELDEALAIDPRHYWSWLQRGIIHSELGEYLLAAGDFGRCTGLQPEFAFGHYNLGYVLQQGGHNSEAVLSYGRALACETHPGVARIQRGLALMSLRRYPEALNDLNEALVQRSDDALLLTIRGQIFEAMKRPAEADADFRSASSRGKALPVSTKQWMRWTYANAVADRLPKQARRAFEEVCREEPKNVQALYGLARLAMERNAAEEALAYFDRTIESDPFFFAARRYRAVQRIRIGNVKGADEDINWCLDREPQNGDTLYAAACVAAIAADYLAEPAFADRACDLLEKAFARGVGLDKVDGDPDLAALRSRPASWQRVQRAKAMPSNSKSSAPQ